MVWAAILNSLKLQFHFENENRKCQRSGILYNDLYNDHETRNTPNPIKLNWVCNVREAQLCVMVLEEVGISVTTLCLVWRKNMSIDRR